MTLPKSKPALRALVCEELSRALEQAGITVRTDPDTAGWEIAVKFQPLKDEVCGVEADPSYLRATFYFDLTALRRECAQYDAPRRWLSEYVRHEVVHLLLSPLAHLADSLAADKQVAKAIDDAHERAANNITVLWCRLLDRSSSQ